MARSLAKRLDDLAPSATLAVTARANELKAAGKRVFPFGVGEPDFPTPEYIREAAARAMKDCSHYPPVAGTKALREAVCQATTRDRGWTPHPDDVVVSVGAKHALFNLALALVNPGDEVLIPAPYWVSYADQVAFLGGVPRIVETAPERGWLMTPEQLEGALTPRTKAVILCSPSNPTGCAYAADELLALTKVLARHDVFVIVDEIYAELVYDGFVPVSLAKLAPELADRLIVVDGVSKTYAMTGWRIGWTISPARVTKALGKIQSQSTTGATVVAQAAATAALLGPRDEVAQMRAVFAARRERMIAGLNAVPGVTCAKPRGAFYAFPDVTGLYGIRHDGAELVTANDVALWQLAVCGIAAVAGEAFGAPGYIRFTYAAAESVIDEAMAVLKATVEAARS